MLLDAAEELLLLPEALLELVDPGYATGTVLLDADDGRLLLDEELIEVLLEL